jgi:(1->4)-alpha-D-glucan 1-alpha-D-glucosylmutase
MAVRVPLATYRIQAHRSFDLQAVRRLVPYLADLGVDTVYLSPLLRAQPGSLHGYDGIDPTQIDPDRGSSADFRSLVRALRARRMGLLLDIVPNHLAATVDNPWWRDILQFGLDSPYARVFDIHWREHSSGRPRVTLPLLSGEIGRAFDLDELSFEVDGTGLVLRCRGQDLPLRPTTVARLLRRSAKGISEKRSRSSTHRFLADFATEAETLLRVRRPLRSTHDQWRRYDDRFLRHLRQHPSSRAAIRGLLQRLNRSRPRDSLRRIRTEILEAQWYELIPWWDVERLNYRRFFDVSELVGIRVEDPVVFELTHKWIFDRLREGSVAGLRIDHIDGLADPEEYLQRLWRQSREAAMDERRNAGVYTLVEKILGTNEWLPKAWPVHGTTGYESMDWITGVLVDPAGLPELERLYRGLVGRPAQFDEIAFAAKSSVIPDLFPAELHRLTRLAQSALGSGAPFPRSLANKLGVAISILTAALPVYRTYFNARTPLAQDDAALLKALGVVGDRCPDAEIVLPLLRRLLRGPERQRRTSRRNPERDSKSWIFTRSWQQWTGAVAAKGVEDTALYRYARFVARNEVGSSPGILAVSLGEFHRFQIERQRRTPLGMTTTSTHDAKRGEDVRARLVVLSEAAEEWADSVARWHRATAPLRLISGGVRSISPDDEYLAYQTIVGAGPLRSSEWERFSERLAKYLVKAAREAKRDTNWIRPDSQYENQLRSFVGGLIPQGGTSEVHAELARWVRRLAFIGFFYSVAQALMKIGIPGIPDFYQGTELWDLNLVDPDNRRPVDFDLRRRYLRRLPRAEIEESATTAGEFLRNWPSGRFKQFAIQRALRFRRLHRALFERGTYLPLFEKGHERFAILAFARRRGSQWAVFAVGRGLWALGSTEKRPPSGDLWKNRKLSLPAGAPRTWDSILDGRSIRAESSARGVTIRLPDLFRHWPFAILGPSASRREGWNGMTRSRTITRLDECHLDSTPSREGRARK